MKRILTILSLALLTLGALAGPVVATVPPVDPSLQRMEGHYYFLGCNLHADMIYNKISSVNYQLPGELLPWGTEVRILRVSNRRLVFEDVSKNRRYTYEFHWKTRRLGVLTEHLNRLFLESADQLKQRVEGLSGIDRDGIYEGRVKPGMSREAVLVAIGYPPEFANREALMTDRDWLYWISRHKKMIVSFGRDGLVSRVNGDY
jgi:hypothetical protein